MALINTEVSFAQLHTDLEREKWSGAKQVGLKTLGVLLIVAAVALYVFSVKCILSMGVPGLTVLSAAFIVTGLGVRCSQIASNNRLEIAQTTLGTVDFMEYARRKNITLKREILFETLDNYAADKLEQEQRIKP